MNLPVYAPSWFEKVQTFLSGLRIRVFPRRVLIVGPYAGEFGIEIIKFQSFVRALASRYEQVHVLTYPGREPLYQGENVTIHIHDFDLQTAGYWYGRRSHDELNEYAARFARKHGINGFDIFNTSLLCTGFHRRFLWRQAHQPFRSQHETAEPVYEVVFHFRGIDKVGPDASRNYRADLAEELAHRCVERGWRCVCIGHPDYSLCFEGCEDRRTEVLSETIGVIRSGRLTVGELSGPIHLAVYCDRPVVTWAPDPHRIAYAKKHNPFGVPIMSVVDTSTHPSPDMVVRAVDGCLAG